MIYTYLAINAACIIVPFIASFYKPHSFAKQLRYFIPVCLFVAFLFLLWDYVFTDWGVWGFNPDYLTGIYLFNLPLEEVLFFICIPYACVFTYYALEYLLPNAYSYRVSKAITLFLMFVLGLVCVLFSFRWYTHTTAILLFAFLSYSLHAKKDLSRAYLSYALILPFFFLSNGILTGSFIEEPIVWYNDQENLGLRMFTIPVEDTFYGLLLILGNIWGFDYLRRK